MACGACCFPWCIESRQIQGVKLWLPGAGARFQREFFGGYISPISGSWSNVKIKSFAQIDGDSQSSFMRLVLKACCLCLCRSPFKSFWNPIGRGYKNMYQVWSSGAGLLEPNVQRSMWVGKLYIGRMIKIADKYYRKNIIIINSKIKIKFIYYMSFWFGLNFVVNIFYFNINI